MTFGNPSIPRVAQVASPESILHRPSLGEAGVGSPVADPRRALAASAVGRPASRNGGLSPSLAQTRKPRSHRNPSESKVVRGASSARLERPDSSLDWLYSGDSGVDEGATFDPLERRFCLTICDTVGRMVYFLASGPDHVKIGYIQDWQRLHTRVRTLQSGNPHHELSVLHVLPGLGPASEHLFHRELSAARLTGEWFDADHDDVRQVIIAAHTGEFDTPEQVSLWAAERQAAREAERRSMSREAIARRAYERQLAEGSLTVRPLDA